MSLYNVGYLYIDAKYAKLYYINGGNIMATSSNAYMNYGSSYVYANSSRAYLKNGNSNVSAYSSYAELYYDNSSGSDTYVTVSSSEARIGYGSNKVVSDSTGTRISVGGYNRLDTNYNGYGALILGRYYNETGYYMSFWGHGIFIKYQSSSGIGGGYDLVQITSTSIMFRPSNSEIFSINQDALYSKRDLYMNGYSVRNQSDRRMKTDFVDASKWDEFYDRLNPCGFKYKNLDNGYHIGFIAQDVEQALTDSGLTKEDFSGLTINPYHKMGDEESDIQDGEDVYNLAYTEFIALNTHEIQKLKTKVSTLESRIEALENLLTNL